MAAQTWRAPQGNTRQLEAIGELPTRVGQRRWTMPGAARVILRVSLALFILVPGIVLWWRAVFFAARDIGMLDRNPM